MHACMKSEDVAKEMTKKGRLEILRWEKLRLLKNWYEQIPHGSLYGCKKYWENTTFFSWYTSNISGWKNQIHDFEYNPLKLHPPYKN